MDAFGSYDITDDQRFQSSGHFGQLRSLAIELACSEAHTVQSVLKVSGFGVLFIRPFN